MLNLIKNEYIKEIKKKSNLIFLIGVIAITILFQFAISKSEQDDSSVEYTYDYMEEENNNSYPYMSKQYVEETLKECKKNDEDAATSTGPADDYYSETYYYELIQQNKLYELDQSVYDVLHKLYTQYYNNPFHITDEEFDSLFQKVAAGDYKAFYQFMIDHSILTNAEYSDVPIYKKLLEDNISPFEDSDEYKRANKALIHLSYIHSDIGKSMDTLDDSYEDELTAFLVDNYCFEHNVDYVILDDSVHYYYDMDYDNFWFGLSTSSMFIALISILMIVIAGSCIAGEFSNGTIKFLLINPKTRSKIFFSKYIMLLTSSAILVFGMFVLNVIVCRLFYTDYTNSTVYLNIVNHVVETSSPWLYIIKTYLLECVSLIVYATLACMLSSLFRSAALAIGASVGLLVSGSIITQILCAYNIDWGRYLVFANTDLANINKGNSLFPVHSLSFAVVMVVIYVVVFLFSAHDAFTRKEV